MDAEKCILETASLEWKASDMTVQSFTSSPPDLQLNNVTNILFLDACWPEIKLGWSLQKKDKKHLCS